MSPGTILRRTIGASMLAGVFAPLTLVLVPTVVLAPMFGFVVASCLRAHLRTVTSRATGPISAISFFIAIVTGGMVLGGIVGAAAGSALTHTRELSIGAGVGASLVPVLALGAFSPLAFVPLVWMERKRAQGVSAVLSAALEGWRSSSALVRFRVGLTVLLPWLVGGGLVLVDADVELWASVLSPVVAFSVPLFSATLVSAWSPVRETALAFRAESRPPRGVGVLMGTALVASLVALPLVGWAVLVPLPMTESRSFTTDRRGLDPRDVAWSSHEAPIPGTSLVVRPDPEGVRIEAADGGGVGLVDYPGVEQVRVEAFPNHYRIHAQVDGLNRAYVDVDGEGVRIDDDFGIRFGTRVGGLGLLLLLGLIVGWSASGAAWGRLQRARALRDLRSSREHEGSATQRRVLEGRLKLGDGTTVRSVRPKLIVEGPAWIEGGELRVAIPPRGVRVRGGAKVAEDESEIALVGRFSQLTSGALREATAPWPEDAMVVLGGRALAVRTEVRRASTIAMLALAPTVAVAVSLAIWTLNGL